MSRLIRDLFVELIARRRGSRYVSNRLPRTNRDAVGPVGLHHAYGNRNAVVETIVHSIDEERRREVLNASRLSQYPSHSVLRRMADDPTEPRLAGNRR